VFFAGEIGMVEAKEPEKLFCTCTKQLLRFSDDGVELLCRYCKRVTLARYEELAGPAGLRRLGRRLLRAARRERST
jgi:hypothetical protein